MGKTRNSRSHRRFSIVLAIKCATMRVSQRLRAMASTTGSTVTAGNSRQSSVRATSPRARMSVGARPRVVIGTGGTCTWPRPSETLTETSWCAGALAANSTDETITSMPSRNRTAATSAFPRAEHNPSEKEGIGSLPGPRGAGRRRCRRCTRRWG